MHFYYIDFSLLFKIRWKQFFLSTMYSEHFKFEYVVLFFTSIYLRNPTEDINSEANVLFWSLFWLIAASTNRGEDNLFTVDVLFNPGAE